MRRPATGTSSSRVDRGAQWLVERATSPLAGEHFLRRPLNQVLASGLKVEQRQRFKLGLAERLIAHKPSSQSGWPMPGRKRPEHEA